jgi:hypothetical protein
MTARPGELTLEMKRVLSATRSVVFGDFSGPEELTNRLSTSSVTPRLLSWTRSRHLRLWSG